MIEEAGHHRDDDGARSQGETALAAPPAVRDDIPTRRTYFRDRPRGWWVQAVAAAMRREQYRTPTTMRRPVGGVAIGASLLPVAVLLVVVAIVFRLYQLSTLPGEFYGDISIIYEYVDDILKGHWPFHFVLSTGPLYGYTIAPVVALLGQQGYLPYKMASVLVSLCGILFAYLFARRLTNTRLALLTGFVLATSSWYLVFSRLGNAQIVIPVITAACFYCLARGITTNTFNVTIAGAVVSALGLYTMPQTFILPFIYVLVSVFYIPLKRVAILCGTLLLSAIPFIFIVINQPDLFFSQGGYIGGKIGANSLLGVISKVLDNAMHSLLMLHVAGDVVFRSNPTGVPQLDIISGLFFLAGLAYWFSKPRRRWLPMLLIPFLLLQIPSILVTSEETATPSASRTIAILPFVAVFVASGMWLVYESLGVRRRWRNVGLAAVIIGITVLNYNRYFSSYADGLPDHNTPIGAIIAGEIDQLPSQVRTYVVGCCWGAWSQPEPNGISYVLKTHRDTVFLPENGFQCQDIAQRDDVYVVFPPAMAPTIKRAVACLGKGETVSHTSPAAGIIFYSFANGAAIQSSAPSATPSPSPAADAPPASFSCTSVGGIPPVSGHHRGKTTSLAALHMVCGCAKVGAAHHATAWHGHALTGAVQLTGACSGTVFRLGRNYDEVSGHIYLDDATGTAGGVITLYDAPVPTNYTTYRLIFNTDIGGAPGHSTAFKVSVSGLQYLAIVERCCTVQNTIVDIVATLSAKSHPSTPAPQGR